MASQEDLRSLVGLLNNSMEADKDVREKAEKILIETAEKNTSVMVQLLLEILKAADSSVGTKKVVCIWLQKIMSSYQSSLPELYSKISLPVQEQFKKEIFIILHKEANQEVRRQISDTIGEIGGSLLSAEAVAVACNKQLSEMWPELLTHVFELYKIGDDPSIESSLGILIVLFMYISDNLTSLHTDIVKLIEDSISRPNPKIQAMAIKTLGSLLTTLSAKEVKAYNKFAVPVLKCQFELYFGAKADQDEAGEVLSVINEIIETEPKFFRSNFKDLIELMNRIRSMKGAEDGIKDQALEITVSISQRYPEFLQKHKEILAMIVEMVFMHILEIPDECPNEWINPPDGFDDATMADDSQKTVRFATDCIDRLCANVGSEFMLKHLSDCVAQLLKSGEWKKIFASFMILSQLGEYMEDVAEISPIVQALVFHSKNEEPRVRYAVMHCVGQMADDFAPKFQEEYHATILPLLLERMSDPIPRVVAHTCASATNFLENCTHEHLKPYFSAFYQKITDIIDAGSSFVKENALGALSALSVCSSELFDPFYNQTMEVLLKIVIQVNDPKYKRLRGNAIECISIISQKIGKDRFAPYADQLIEGMVNIQNFHMVKGEDPQRNFILLAWPRLSEVLKEDFLKYIPVIAPSLVKICKDLVDSAPKDVETIEPATTKKQEEANIEREDIHTYHDDECNNALAALGCMMEDCPESMAPYIQICAEVIVPLLDYLTNEDVRTTAAECLPAMVKSLKLNPVFQSQVPAFTKHLIDSLWKVMEDETQPEILIKQATAIQELVEAGGNIMSDVELEGMYNKCMYHLKKSDERKKATDSQVDDEEDEPEILEVHEQDKDMENQYNCAIAEIFGKLFLTHKERALPIYEQLHNMFIATSLKDDQTDLIKKFGLFLICDSVDHLGILIGDARLEQYYQYLKKYCLYPMVYVRHAAVYGLGAMALILKEKFSACALDSLGTLQQSLQVPRGAEDEEVFKATRENTVSAIGKVIKAVWALTSAENKVSYVNGWIDFLPLKTDKIEAIIQHEYLIDWIEKDSPILLNKPENYGKCLKIFASIWKTKSSNAALDAQITLILRRWSQDPAIIPIIASVNLTEKQTPWWPVTYTYRTKVK